MLRQGLKRQLWGVEEPLAKHPAQLIVRGKAVVLVVRIVSSVLDVNSEWGPPSNQCRHSLQQVGEPEVSEIWRLDDKGTAGSEDSVDL
jgi:hypothetical protein